jgi:hypothetical protein
MIVEYKFHRTQDGRHSVPTFIIDGGYFIEGNKLVGIAANDGSYIPSTLVVLDKAALITKLTNIGYTMFDADEPNERRLATAEEIEAEVDRWISAHDV